MGYMTEQIVFLAGGLGIRMRSDGEIRPKPMTLIGGFPIIEHLINHATRYGVKKVLILVGYKGDMIRDYYLNYNSRKQPFTVNLNSGEIGYLGDSANHEADVQVTILDTGELSLTGERLRRAEEYLEDDFFLTYSDGLSDIDLNSLRIFHDSHEFEMTLSVTKPISRFGVVEMDENSGQILNFGEKSRQNDLINMGYFLMNKTLINEILPNTMIEIDLLPKLSQAGRLAGYHHKGFFAPMDSPRDADSLNELWNQGTAPWII